MLLPQVSSRTASNMSRAADRRIRAPRRERESRGGSEDPHPSALAGGFSNRANEVAVEVTNCTGHGNGSEERRPFGRWANRANGIVIGVRISRATQAFSGKRRPFELWQMFLPPSGYTLPSCACPASTSSRSEAAPGSRPFFAASNATSEAMARGPSTASLRSSR